MNSNKHPSAYGYQPHSAAGNKQFWQPTPETTLKNLFIEVERKVFCVALKENARGRFLRITEQSGVKQGGSKQSAIIIPSTGLKDFHTVLGQMIQIDAGNNPPPASDQGR